MPVLLGLLATFLTLLAPAWAADARPEPATDDPVAAIEDPRRLGEMGEQALAEGRRDEAQKLFEAMLGRMEVKSYLPYRKELGQAFVLERLGDAEAAARLYREQIAIDPLYTVLFLRILSHHPDRERIVGEAYDFVRRAAEEAKAGGQPVIYVTSKGEPRTLEKTTTEELLARIGKGEKIRYCYVEELDFTKVKGPLPDEIVLDRCVVGRIYGPELVFEKLAFKGFVLGDTDLGKTFTGEKNKSSTLQPSKFGRLFFREAVFLGRANFSAIEVGPDGMHFPMAVFEGAADFKGAEIDGVTDLRFASFGKGANFRLMRMHQPVYFVGSRYRDDTVFSELYSERDVYFGEAWFEGRVSFDGCEFQRGATFENSRFDGPASFGTSIVAGNLNLSRAVFNDTVDVKEVQVGELDALGTHFHGKAHFMDAVIAGRARFSIDEVTRHAVREDLDALLGLYRHYQGDEDADAPITTKSSYGVRSLDDLSARIDRDISFANTAFGGYTVFEGVQFGQPGVDAVASFFNSQFLGETHFERTEWFSKADFTTIFGNEVAFNNAHFHRSLSLDDANVSGRVTLTDATFEDGADLSFYGADIASFQIDPSQVAGVDEPHRLFYERCAHGRIDRSDVRIARIARGEELSDEALARICYDFVIDEFVLLKDSYGDRAMTAAEDDAYWWARHHEAVRDAWYADAFTRLKAFVFRLGLFELCFGWGVRLGNLAITALTLTVTYAVAYRLFCPNTMLQYDGEEMPIRDVPFLGLCYVSLQSMIAVNTGWDFGDDDHRFRVLNLSETVIGVIILTFFVGAYTRMILA